MDFSLAHSIELLTRTPLVLRQLTTGLSHEWIYKNEGGETWSVYDVLGHLVHGEKTDWMRRVEIILSNQGDKTFPGFDRFAQFEESQGKSLDTLLSEFEETRHTNLRQLTALNITGHDLIKTGIHPVFGQVTLAQLLATWTVHDLDHISQVSRVMAYQYRDAVGPWAAFLRNHPYNW